MTLTWGDEPNGAVAMLVVVPVHEAGHPLLSRRQALVAVHRVVGPVLAGPEQRLREGVVIGDPGAAVRRGNVPGKTHEKPLYDGLRSALPVGAYVVI